MPEISVPRTTVTPRTDIGVQIPTGLLDREFEARRGFARAFGQFGPVAGQAAVNTLRAQGDEEFTRAKLGYETEFRKFSAELSTDTDYAGYTKRFNDWHDQTTADLSAQVNHRGAQQRTKDQFDLNRATKGRAIDTFAQNTLVTQTRALLPEKIEGFVSEELAADTPETMIKAVNERKAYFQTLIETGVTTAEENLEKQYQQAKGERVLNNTVNAIALDPDPNEGGWDKALDWLDDPKNSDELLKDFGITLVDVQSLVNAVKARAQRKRSEGIIKLDRERIEAGNDFFSRLDALTRGTDQASDDSFDDLLDDIERSVLLPIGVNSKTTWSDKVNAQSDAIRDKKENLLDQSDPAVYRPLRIKADTDPGSVSIAEINEVWGKGEKGGISTSQRDKLLKIITDASDPLNEASAKRAQARFNRGRTTDLNIFVGPAAQRIDEDIPQINQIEAKWDKISDEYDTWIQSEEGLKATDAQKEAKVSSLTEPVIEEVTLGFLGTVITGFVRSGRGKFDIALTKKKIGTLEQRDEFIEASAGEQQRAIDFIRAGGTVQNAVEELRNPLPTPTTQAEFDAIPAGTIFIDTDGIRTRKQ